jgi:hypothetical protein
MKEYVSTGIHFIFQVQEDEMNQTSVVENYLEHHC